MSNGVHTVYLPLVGNFKEEEMTKLPTGKFMYVWKATPAVYGDPAAAAEAAKEAGVRMLLIKVANAASAYNETADLPKVIAEAEKRGIDCWGWGYVYGANPTGEANIAASQVKRYGLKGWVIDAEAEYKELANRATAARTYAQRLAALLPAGLPVALSSYRYPSVHMQLPWKEFLAVCTFVMPQVYWQAAHNPADQLVRSFNEYNLLYKRLGCPALPYVPVGSAYAEHGWVATPEDVTKFLTQARAMNLSGAGFWEWWHARTRNPQLWEAIKCFPWSAAPAPAPEPEPGDLLALLDARVTKLEVEARKRDWPI